MKLSNKRGVLEERRRGLRHAHGKVVLALIFLYFENNNFFDDFHDEIDKRGENESDNNCVLLYCTHT